jgi:curved DNA-binding protein CbpA
VELNPFELLGVMPTATDAEILSAHDRLSSVFDPDRWRDACSEVQLEALRWTQALELAVQSALGMRAT